MNKKNLGRNGEKGITLVALIITIIVLLILAVVAIRAVQGDGIIQYAQNSVNEYNTGKETESSKLDEYSAFIDSQTQSSNTAAEDNNPTDDSNITTWAIGSSGEGEGVIAKYNQDTKILTISKNGDSSDGLMKDFTYNTQPWKDVISEITTVVIEEGIENIGDYAFYNCKTLFNTTLPESLTSIGKYAFYNCTTLSNTTLPENLTSIDWLAFSKTNLSNVTLPSNLQYLGALAFNSCDSLNTINIPGSLTETGHMVFGESYITNITIDENFDITLEGIDQDIFRFCDYIFETYGNGVFSIESKEMDGGGVFYYYREEITINGKTRSMTYETDIYW